MPDKKVLLGEADIPTRWYNLAADLAQPLQPPRHPATHDPLSAEEMAPLVSAAVEQGLVEPIAIGQLDAIAAGLLFAHTEGIVPAPEANHAIHGAILEARRSKAEGRKEVIAFNLCGHGHMDMSAYDAYLAGKLDNVTYDEQALALSLSNLPAME